MCISEGHMRYDRSWVTWHINALHVKRKLALVSVIVHMIAAMARTTHS